MVARKRDFAMWRIRRPIWPGEAPPRLPGHGSRRCRWSRSRPAAWAEARREGSPGERRSGSFRSGTSPRASFTFSSLTLLKRRRSRSWVWSSTSGTLAGALKAGSPRQGNSLMSSSHLSGRAQDARHLAVGLSESHHLPASRHLAMVLSPADKVSHLLQNADPSGDLELGGEHDRALAEHGLHAMKGSFQPSDRRRSSGRRGSTWTRFARLSLGSVTLSP